MIKGKKRVRVDREFILSKLSPFDIFRLYYPGGFEVNRPCSNVFKRDENPSMVIGTKSENGELRFKCFNSSHRGDCFEFVMQLGNLDYDEALHRIAKDFGLIESDNTERYKQIISSYEQPTEVVEPMYIQAKTKKITQKEIDYLASYHLTLKDMNFCKDTSVFSVGDWALNRTRQGSISGEICFGYHLHNDIGSWIKLYWPQRDKKNKWRSTIPFSMLHGAGNIQSCDIGIISKSMKDGAFIHKYLVPNVEIMQAEDLSAITDEDIARIKSSCKRLYICFDGDAKGQEASLELAAAADCERIIPPSYLLKKGITDFTDWGKATDVQTVVDFWKEEGVLE